MPIVIRKHKTARHMVLRYQCGQQCIALTLPRYVTIGQGLRFVEERREWILSQLAEQKDIPYLADGTEIMVLGERLTIRHVGGRGVVHRQGNSIMVPGDPVFLPRRLSDWLKKSVRSEISRLAQAKAEALGRTIRKISIRDTRSLWGSCNEKACLSFSWRLVLAPYAVLDYVVSHEVAHLVELNHSPAFWRVVEQLCPNWRESREWLKTYGRQLHAHA